MYSAKDMAYFSLDYLRVFSERAEFFFSGIYLRIYRYV